MSAPRITVITPSYNQAGFLEKTIQSVLGQDYPDLEYFVIDGGSTDGSQAVIERYAGRLAWWVSEKDRGQADAVNKGLARASGEIIGWVNSDDLYLPGALSGAAAAFDANPQAGLVFSNVRAIDENGDTTNLMRYGNWGLDDLMTFHIIGQPGVFLRRSVLEKVGYLDLSYHYMLDHQLWLRMAQAAPMVYVDTVWAAARYHSSAKNIALAPRFGQDAYAIAHWMSGEPGLKEPYQRLERRVWAGAHRMNARYMLDGGQNVEAIRCYWKSILCYPPIGLSEAHRMVYAALSLVGMGWLKPVYLRLRRRIKGYSRSQPDSLARKNSHPL